MSATVEDLPPLPQARSLISRLAPGFKLVLVGTLLLVMLIPDAMISSVIRERESYQHQVRADIARSWGPAQSIQGPVLILPTRSLAPRLPNETGPIRYERGTITILPARLRAEARLAPERRKRGLFEAVVYSTDVALSGSFTIPALNLPPETEALWREAHLLSGATDLRAASDDARLTWDGRALTTGETEANGCRGFELLRWNLGLEEAPPADRSIAFQGTMPLRGTGSLHLLTRARRAELELSAPWSTPSFTGSGLPIRSDVTENAFTASWSEAGSAALIRTGPFCESGTRQVGVELLEAVPTYRMVSRASKYAIMFLALSFLTYVLFELIARVRIHLIQYGLLGLSVVLFPLLLLAFGEPLGFAAAYAISAGAVMAQACAYTAAVTRRIGLAAVFAGVLGALFGFLYVTLSLENYALLTGAVALFAALSLVMMVTRRVDWAGGRETTTQPN
ncbi:cell envelope integrity protein CreD [Muricoccus radiodurans]|uniref:cell envelope integrity protein CreD n=1 Tax=Muricoccus radiodurans TaxID=2231721 RepID=UPI003CF648F9